MCNPYQGYIIYDFVKEVNGVDLNNFHEQYVELPEGKRICFFYTVTDFYLVSLKYPNSRFALIEFVGGFEDRGKYPTTDRFLKIRDIASHEIPELLQSVSDITEFEESNTPLSPIAKLDIFGDTPEGKESNTPLSPIAKLDVFGTVPKLQDISDSDCKPTENKPKSTNTGPKNIGDYNSGFFNIGCYNTGILNKGNRNSGHNNIGDYNSGDWNLCDNSSGCFNTQEQTIILFNKPSNWTYSDWKNSHAHFVLNRIGNYEIARHGVRPITPEYTRQDLWDRLSQEDKDAVLSIPNFDADIFKEITGITV